LKPTENLAQSGTFFPGNRVKTAKTFPLSHEGTAAWPPHRKDVRNSDRSRLFVWQKACHSAERNTYLHSQHWLRAHRRGASWWYWATRRCANRGQVVCWHRPFNRRERTLEPCQALLTSQLNL